MYFIVLYMDIKGDHLLGNFYIAYIIPYG